MAAPKYSYEYVINKAVARSVARGGALIAASMTPEERSERSRRGWLRRRARHEAQHMLSHARKKEPRIRSDLQRAVADNGGRMIGLPHRFKTEESLVRKLYDKSVSKGTTPERYAKKVVDSVRFTALVKEPPPGAYSKVVGGIIESLKAKNYELVEMETHWLKGDAYNGLHLVFESPTGQLFETQVHTPESLRAVRMNHYLYEEFRNKKTTPERRRVLAHRMTANADRAPVPLGALEWGVQIWRDPNE